MFKPTVRPPQRSPWVRLIAAHLLVAVLLALAAGVVSAHPLGNFTVNRYSQEAETSLCAPASSVSE